MPGDHWQTWFDRHGTALVLLARQFVRGRTDAEDVVQEAFVRFWRSRERVAEPVAFLFACVRRCALDWQRSRRRQTHREEQTARPEAEPLFAAAEKDECSRPFEYQVLDKGFELKSKLMFEGQPVTLKVGR